MNKIKIKKSPIPLLVRSFLCQLSFDMIISKKRLFIDIFFIIFKKNYFL